MTTKHDERSARHQEAQHSRDTAAQAVYDRKRHPDTPPEANHPAEAKHPPMRDLSGEDWATLGPLLAAREERRAELDAHRKRFPNEEEDQRQKHGLEPVGAPFQGGSREELVAYVEGQRLWAAFKAAAARFDAALRVIVERETANPEPPPAPQPAC